MGIKANTLRYRSKRGGEIIVGSEIRAALDELENENSELRAQLARCVRGLGTYRKCFEDGFASKILDELPSKAKADAEVLRCADKIHEEYFYGNDDEKALRHNRLLVRSIHNAVRAAREVSDA